MVQKNVIKCEDCKKAASVIIDKKKYLCPECYLFEKNIPIESGIHRLRKEGLYDKLKN